MTPGNTNSLAGAFEVGPFAAWGMTTRPLAGAGAGGGVELFLVEDELGEVEAEAAASKFSPKVNTPRRKHKLVAKFK